MRIAGELLARAALVASFAMLAACGLDASGMLIEGADGGAPTVDAQAIDASADASFDASADSSADTSVRLDAAVPDATADASPPRDAAPPPDSSPPDAAPDAGCSVTSTSPVNLKFENKSMSITYEKLWVDFQCRPVSYGTIGPGEKQMIGSFATHVWEMRDTTTNAIVTAVQLPQGGSYTITVP